MAISNPSVWYARDNSTCDLVRDTSGNAFTVGSVGWSGITAWAPSAGSITPGTIRRQSGANANFTASRSGTTLTVTAVSGGTITLGQRIFLTGGVTSLGTITALGTGTGGTGTYTTSASSTVGSQTMVGAMPQTNQLAFIATQSGTGTTGATEPNWSSGSAKGTKITDNTVTWVECTGQPAVNNDFTNTPNWAASQAATVGQIIKDLAGTHAFICTTAGTTKSGAEPSWVTTSVGSTTTDNTATWTYIGTSFGAWAAPLATITQSSTWIANGATIYVGDDHVEQLIANSTVNPPIAGSSAAPLSILSIDHTSTNRPPSAAADLKAGAATQTVAGNGGLTILGTAYWYGFTFDPGFGLSANSETLNIGGVAGTAQKYDTCTFNSRSTGASGSKLVFGGSGATSLDFYNCAWTAAAAASGFNVNTGGMVTVRGGTVCATGTLLNPMIASNTGSGSVLFEGVDLSTITGTICPAGTAAACGQSVTFADCKLNASATLASTPVDRGGPNYDFVRCSSNSNTYIQRRYRNQGTLSEEATIIRTGGASDGTTGISWNLTTTANAQWQSPFESFPIAIWNATTGSDVVVTLHGIWNSASLPNNDDVWVDVEYLGDATPTPLGKYKLGSKSNILASNGAQAADSVSAWDSLATARAQNHAYSLGDVISASNNSGRIFFCTVAGTSANTALPAGYASVVDGGTISDGGATFRAGTRFTLTVTLTSPAPQLVGYLQAIVRAAKVSSTFYVDPLIVIS